MIFIIFLVHSHVFLVEETKRVKTSLFFGPLLKVLSGYSRLCRMIPVIISGWFGESSGVLRIKPESVTCKTRTLLTVQSLQVLKKYF